MANYELFQKIAKALALGEGANARELIEQMPDEDEREYVVYIAAVFTELVDALFEEDHGLVAIKDFVDEMANAYRTAKPPFRSLAMEVLIRAVYDEDQSLDEVSAKEQLRYQTMALRMIVHKSPGVYAQLDQYLAEAKTLALEWLSEV
ncbi:hypothetical protein [Glycomyces niveus]|uniref:Immunity protein 30 domain-containing protein n=1 Tax=Glycomyces niveus TaxID=2820287 RepID=A0ABS3U7D7_9ACTN|nr:hypothetical protein [Glycomyces sp. NEAU-S30]MBO3734694.1 hypothetical protein [Glycomyces sp. NEAU-S30]